jgi:DNA-binding response OmpR family regulator
VLLVDNAVDEREMYAEFLRHFGFHTFEAGNAADAYRLAIELAPNIVVTDVVLPGTDDGVALARLLKHDKRTSGVPVIILSGRMVRRDEDVPCDRFLVKPCLPEDLLQEIRQLLAVSVKLQDDPARQPRRVAKARLKAAKPPDDSEAFTDQRRR